MIENPPWVDRVLRTHWAALNAASPVPLYDLERFGGRAHEVRYGGEELGCGSYGCVLDTKDPGVVFKLTTDPTEAQFITEAMRLGEPPTGIVRYLQILPLEDSHKNRPVFAIWREAARGVGSQLGYYLRNDYDRRIAAEAEHRLGQWIYVARIARTIVHNARHPSATIADAKQNENWAWQDFEFETIEHSRLDLHQIITKYFSRWRGGQKLAMCLRALEVVSEMGENEAFMPEVFGALGFYLDAGLLLADIHWGNIGKVFDREDYQDGVRVITDPGHLVDLRIP